MHGTLQGLDLSVTKVLETLEVDVPILLAGGAGSIDFSSALSIEAVHGASGFYRFD